MRLTQFIRQHHDKIIREWIEFAGSLLPWAKDMSEKELRDHAAELLDAVVSDMETPETTDEQSAKSQGQSAGGALASVGHKHAAQRLGTGFNLSQLVSEYRALRASILRQWAESLGDQLGEVTRFNEAIDESLAEATATYAEMLDGTREEFLAILGHDLRNPLSSVIMGATFLTKSESIDDKNARVATRILSSADRMNRMVSDLLDLTRSRLGDGIPITPKPMDLAVVCRQVLAELEATHPDCHLRFESKGDLHGEWDSDRLAQVISNLVANALQYGVKDGEVSVVAETLGEEVALRVHNDGHPIPEASIKKIFESMVRQPTSGSDTNRTGLGLGLYIARELATAHGGTIRVTSTAKEGTTFTMQLPRHPRVTSAS